MKNKTMTHNIQDWQKYWNSFRGLCTYDPLKGDIYTPLSGGNFIDMRDTPSDKLLAIAWIEVHNALAKEGETIYPIDTYLLDENDKKLWNSIKKDDHIYAINPSKAAFLAFIGLLTLSTREREGKPTALGLKLFNDIVCTLPEYMTQLQNCGFNNKEAFNEMYGKAEHLKNNYNFIDETVLPNIASALNLKGIEKSAKTSVNTSQAAVASEPVSVASSINRESPPPSKSAEEMQPLLAPASAGNFNFRRIGQYILAGSAASIFVGAVTVIGAVAGAGLIGGLITAGTLGMGLPLGIAIGGMAGAAVGAVSGAAITGIVMAVAYFWKRPGSNPGGGGSKNNSNQEPDSMFSSHAQMSSRFPQAGNSKKPTQTRENQASAQIFKSNAKSQETNKKQDNAHSSRNAPRS